MVAQQVKMNLSVHCTVLDLCVRAHADFFTCVVTDMSQQFVAPQDTPTSDGLWSAGGGWPHPEHEVNCAPLTGISVLQGDGERNA